MPMNPSNLDINILNRLDTLEKQMSILINEKINIHDNIKQTFEKYIINDYTLQRMSTLNESNQYKNYSEFLDWNIKCISELSPDKRLWLYNLCVQITNNEIKLMDEESCAIFEASNIFFDSNKKLCIANPR